MAQVLQSPLLPLLLVGARTLEVQRESEALLALQHDVQRDAVLAQRHSSKQTTVALMQKLKNQVFPATFEQSPDSEGVAKTH